MDLTTYDVCFLLERHVNIVRQSMSINGASIGNGEYNSLASYSDVFVNFTKHDVMLVYADGRKTIIKRSLSSVRNIHADSLERLRDEYDGQFVLVRYYNNHFKYVSGSSTYIEDDKGNLYDINACDLKSANIRNEKVKPTDNPFAIEKEMPIVHCQSITNEDFCNNIDGVMFAKENFTAGWHHGDYEPSNKMASAFPNSAGGRISAGIRIVAYVSTRNMPEMSVVIGGNIFNIEPCFKKGVSETLHIYKTDSSGKEKLSEAISLEDAKAGKHSDIRVFKCLSDASDYVKKLQSSINDADALRKKIDDLEEEVKKHKDDARNAKNEAKSEKAKAGNSKWQKAAAIIGAVATVVTAIYGIVKLFL